MRFSSITALLATASIAAAAPVSPAKENPLLSLNKRDTWDECGTPYPRFTEARLADIIVDFSDAQIITVNSGVQGQLVSCHGGTGVFLSVDAGNFNLAFDTADLANDLNNGFYSCTGHYASTRAGDLTFAASFQHWETGWNMLVHGSAC